MQNWQPIETAEVGQELWLTDGKAVVKGKFLGPYRTGYSIAERMGWFKLTHWMDTEAEPAPPSN